MRPTNASPSGWVAGVMNCSMRWLSRSQTNGTVSPGYGGFLAHFGPTHNRSLADGENDVARLQAEAVGWRPGLNVPTVVGRISCTP